MSKLQERIKARKQNKIKKKLVILTLLVFAEIMLLLDLAIKIYL